MYSSFYSLWWVLFLSKYCLKYLQTTDNDVFCSRYFDFHFACLLSIVTCLLQHTAKHLGLTTQQYKRNVVSLFVFGSSTDEDLGWYILTFGLLAQYQVCIHQIPFTLNGIKFTFFFCLFVFVYMSCTFTS